MSEPLTSKDLVVGGFYNWKGQPERLSYIGARRYNGDSRTWHQFALVDVPGVCWCEVLDSDLQSFERSRALAAQHGSVGEPWGVDANKLLANAMKPSEIAGPPDAQRRRVGELLSWFARLADGQANPKWTTEHAFELAYYIAAAPTEAKPATQQASGELEAFERDPFETAIDAYLADYSTEYDKTSYDPSDEERFRMKDAIMGLLADPEWDRLWGEHIESLVAQRAALSTPAQQDAVDADWLSNVIRSVDGNNTMGAGALAEKIVAAISAKKGGQA